MRSNDDIVARTRFCERCHNVYYTGDPSLCTVCRWFEEDKRE